MEKKESGEEVEKKEEEMEKVALDDGEKKPEAAVDDGDKKPEGEEETKPAAVCFRKAAGGDDASVLDTTKDYFKQLTVTDADTHWDCIKGRVRAARDYLANKTSSAFGRQKVEPEVVKEEETLAAKPEAPAAAESQ